MSLRLTAEEIAAALAPLRAPSSETAARLATWSEVLDRWSRAQRLVGWRSAAQLLESGIADAWRGRAVVGDAAFATIVDVGSGAGLPGLLLAADFPDRPVHLVEARRKRASFLREAARAMGLPQVQVHHGRSDEIRARLGPLRDLLFVSRAFASPEDALGEAAAWNATLALVTSSPARVEASRAWPPEGWRTLRGNFRADMARDHHELLTRTDARTAS